MRDIHSCIKCSHHEILFVPQLRDTDSDVMTVDSELKSVWTGDTARFGQLQAYICLKCGYTELYTLDPASIPLSKIEGAKVLVSKPAAPFR